MFCFVFSGQDVSLNATYTLGMSYDQQDNSQEADYTDDVVNLGAEGCEEGDVEEEGYQQEEEEYTEGYSQDENADMPEDQMDYTGELAEGEDGYQDEVLDIQINEPLDGEFQVSSHICLLTYKCLLMHTQTHTRTHTSSTSIFCLTLLYPRDNVSFLVSVRGKSGLKIYSGEGDVGWRFWARED